MTPKRPLRDGLAVLAAEIVLDKRQWFAVAICAAVALAAAYSISIAPSGAGRLANWGFGPEWDCGNPVKGSDLVCIKKPAPKPN